METYRLKLEPLTPIHIGSGEELEAYEYIIDDRLYKLNLSAVLDILPPDEKAQMIEFMEKNILGLRDFLKRKFKENEKIRTLATEYEILISERVKELYDRKITDPKNVLEVRLFQRDQSGPYIPGSSIKGAIRTAILYGILIHEKKGLADNLLRNKSELKNFEKRVLGYKDAKSDPLRAIKVTDSLTRLQTVVAACTVHTKRGGKWEQDKYQLMTEVFFKSESFTSKSEIELRIDTELQTKQAPEFRKITFEEISKNCKAFYLHHFEREKKRLAGSPAEKIYQNILSERLFEIERDDFSFPIRLGWGSGYDAVTLNSAFKPGRKTRSVKLVEGLPLGWAKLALTDRG